LFTVTVTFCTVLLLPVSASPLYAAV